jgi:gamma-glutamylcyclotransferase (GGCT)/AIG2-like uncharacterized protein YtfP
VLQLLFSYGTFKDINVQRSIFGREVCCKPACLEGYNICADKDGYYYLIESEDKENKVYGLVLELSQRELWLADQWEEVPVYEREKLKVQTSNGIENAWVYFKNDIQFSHYVYGKDISSLKEDDLKKELDSFSNERDLVVPICDYYLVYSCILKDRSKYDSISEFSGSSENSFTSIITKNYNKEVEDQNLKRLKHKYIEKIRIYINNYSINAYIYVAIDEETKLGAITISIPFCYSSTIQLFKNALNLNLKTEDGITINDYITKFGLDLTGRPTCCIFSSDYLSEDMMSRLFSIENCVDNKELKSNLLIYMEKCSDNKFYASKHCLVQVDEKFGDRYKDRIESQIRTLVIVQGLLLKSNN